MAKRVFILGSCVSRDPFELPHHHTPEIVKYLARTSLAAQAIDPFVDGDAVSMIESNFQRNMVLADMEKTAFRDLTSLSFDALIIDFIDDRFPILVSGKRGATLSTEYIEGRAKAGGAELSPDEVIEAKPSIKMQWWEEGFGRLLGVMERNHPGTPIIINRVYWAERTIDGDPLPIWIGNAREENDYLDSLYRRCSAAPAVRFIDYPGTFLADPRHVWGLSPFHYPQDVYQNFLGGLLAIIV